MDHLSLRRLRQNKNTRELTREVRLSPDQLIQPHFVMDGISERQEVKGMTGVHRETSDSLLRQLESDYERGVRKILLFGVPAEKSHRQFTFDFTAEQVERIRGHFGDSLWVSTDVCLCSYTDHGHCGIVSADETHVHNDATVKELAKAALTFAQAGADCVAPSDMMDGRVKAIREKLDKHGLCQTLIMSYSAKFHSGYYGPFRNAAKSAPKGSLPEQLTDRATYQIDPTRPTDARLSSMRDAEEGADILMVKPGLPYLDILKDLSQQIQKPWAVYEVSGEYAAIELLAAEGLVNRKRAHVEKWIAFVRAGASMIISYGTRNAREWISEMEV